MGQLNLKQEEEIENEKRLLITRLKNQEKTLDHIERAKRKLEIPLLEEIIKNDNAYEQQLWKEREKNRIADAIAERNQDLKNRDRLGRMKQDKHEFMSTLLSQRKATYEKKLAEYEAKVIKERKVRLENRRLDRIEERKMKYDAKIAEEKKRIQDEEAKRKKEEKEREEAKEKARLDAEYKEKEEKLNRMAEKQRQKEREVEERRKRESPLNVQDKAGINVETPEKSSSQGIIKWQKGGNMPQSPGPSRGDQWRQKDREVEKPYRSFDRSSSQDRGKLDTNVEALDRKRGQVENRWQKGGNDPQSPAPSRVVDGWRQRSREEEKPKQAYVPPFMRKMQNQSRNRLSSEERAKPVANEDEDGWQTVGKK